jgi:hypothetical protein
MDIVQCTLYNRYWHPHYVFSFLLFRVSKSKKAGGYGEAEGNQLLSQLLEQVQQLKQLRNKLSEQHQQVLRLSPLQNRSIGKHTVFNNFEEGMECCRYCVCIF